MALFYLCVSELLWMWSKSTVFGWMNRSHHCLKENFQVDQKELCLPSGLGRFGVTLWRQQPWTKTAHNRMWGRACSSSSYLSPAVFFPSPGVLARMVVSSGWVWVTNLSGLWSLLWGLTQAIPFPSLVQIITGPACFLEVVFPTWVDSPLTPEPHRAGDRPESPISLRAWPWHSCSTVCGLGNDFSVWMPSALGAFDSCDTVSAGLDTNGR